MMKLVHYYNKLKSLKVGLGESYLIWQVLESLPSQFDVLKTSYNTQKEEWTIDEMIAIVSQEEASIKKTKSHSVQFIGSTSGYSLNIAFAINALGRYLSDLGLGHWKDVKKILRYLQGTKDHMLAYKKFDQLQVIVYSDSDFATTKNMQFSDHQNRYPNDQKSTYNFVFMMVGGVISWKSVKQTLITTSTMGAEYVTCCEATCQAVWLKNLIPGFHIVECISKPLVIYCDNTTAMHFS
uniref:Retrovirus-related Pol polyprotein from transposon TNT 1-94 n=1 Tax=Cajanus cajan TaxID=3821 RepID=A0A151RMF3_CAJCA|nr:Retrovirus-related Pol polyprotein from transposon TNT 1-94 [Cajanus cajan]